MLARTTPSPSFPPLLTLHQSSISESVFLLGYTKNFHAIFCILLLTTSRSSCLSSHSPLLLTPANDWGPGFSFLLQLPLKPYSNFPSSNTCPSFLLALTSITINLYDFSENTCLLSSHSPLNSQICFFPNNMS